MSYELNEIVQEQLNEFGSETNTQMFYDLNQNIPELNNELSS